MRTALLSRRPVSARALTVSGNEMADTFGIDRRTNTQGDGIAFGTQGGVGVWPSATNLNLNGNATTNTTGITDNSSTTTRVTTGTVKFGVTAFQVVSGNAAANEGPSQAIDGGLASTQYTVSAWAWLVSGAATVRATVYDSISGKQGGTAVVLTATPQRVTVTATTGALGINEASYIETTVQQAGTWRIGGWQVETGNIATPYIQTDGGTAARTAGRIRLPVSDLLTATQGWVAYRKILGTGATGTYYDFNYRDADNNERLSILQAATFPRWQVVRFTGGAGATAESASAAQAAGDINTVIGAWEATRTRISVDGVAFVNAVNSSIPALTTTTVDICSFNGGGSGTGTYLWFAFGSGTLTDADATFLHNIGLGGGVPDLYDLPGICNAVWDGRNQTVQVRG